ncbi:hypothetical protein PanWU01x14_107200 [Parasponia andersonii]|uniref:Uncharacterized protein n=1 Tax=Parasponia andersonii TaxID=3476 RepID=A0A2P5D069_PARAD|nr:hypothetical protein PanWU01x14_107200 [Parasponia andersonii]
MPVEKKIIKLAAYKSRAKKKSKIYTKIHIKNGTTDISRHGFLKTEKEKGKKKKRTKGEEIEEKGEAREKEGKTPLQPPCSADLTRLLQGIASREREVAE